MFFNIYLNTVQITSVNKVKQHLYTSFVYCKGSELFNKSYISIWIVWKNQLKNQTVLDILCCIFASFYFHFILSSVILSLPLDSVNRISYRPESQPIFYLSFPCFAANFSTPGVCSTSSLTKLCFSSSGAVAVARLSSPLPGRSWTPWGVPWAPLALLSELCPGLQMLPWGWCSYLFLQSEKEGRWKIISFAKMCKSSFQGNYFLE